MTVSTENTYFVCVGRADGNTDESPQEGSCGWNSIDSEESVDDSRYIDHGNQIVLACPNCKGGAYRVELSEFWKVGVSPETAYNRVN